MLIEFSVGNYLSIKDKQTLRMDASSITEYQDRLIDAGRYKLLRSAVIYGANASGKSNVLKAMATMRQIIITSAAQSSTATISVEPFLLSTETEHAPSYFEMLFLLDGVRYRYGFEADTERIHTEWLFEQKKQKEKALFVREDESIEVGAAFKEAIGLEGRTSSNKLFLAISDQFNVTIGKKIIRWLGMARIASGIVHDDIKHISSLFINEKNTKSHLSNFIDKFNLGFSEIQIDDSKSITIDNKEQFDEQYWKAIDEIKSKRLKTKHTKYNSTNDADSYIFFDLEEKESSGTKKIIDMSAYIYGALMLGNLLIIDELDAKLHPLLTKIIIDLYNDPLENKNNAQLIFATHDTNLLSCGRFRRDQIYFTEKDKYGATSLYSLVEYKEEAGSMVRKDRSFEKDYIQGRYGAIPYIGDLSKLF